MGLGVPLLGVRSLNSVSGQMVDLHRAMSAAGRGERVNGLVMEAVAESRLLYFTTNPAELPRVSGA